jgi:hypothetical protein
MAHDMFGVRRGKGDDDPGPDKTRTPEEEALLEKAREEAARRAEERRGNAGDVGDFLSDMLEASAPPRAQDDAAEAAPSEQAPSVNLDLGGETRRSSAKAEPEAPSPFAAFAEEAEEQQPIVRRASQVQGVRPDDEALREGPAGRELSALMSTVRDELMGLGKFPGEAVLAFEPEGSAGDTSRTMERLVKERRRHPAPFSFEPEEAAVEPDKTSFEAAPIVPPAMDEADAAVEAASAEDSSLISREYSLDDLPDSSLPESAPDGGEELPPPAEDDSLQDAELTGTELLSAAEEDRDDDSDEPDEPGSGGPGVQVEAGAGGDGDADYNLDDLPSTPDGVGFKEEDAESPVEPAMEETSLDDHELDAALAAVGEPVPSHGSEQTEADVARTSPTERTPASYDLEDLPAVPEADSMAVASEEQTGPQVNDVQLVDQSLPDLVPPTAEAVSAEPTRQGGYTGVERAMEAGVEPPLGAAGSPLAAGAGDLPAAEHAVDLNIGQLAEVERLLEKEVQFEENRTSATARVDIAESRFAALARRLGSMLTRIATALSQARELVDGRLVPYSLSCKTLLGIAGVVTLAIVGALSVKTWVLPS